MNIIRSVDKMVTCYGGSYQDLDNDEVITRGLQVGIHWIDAYENQHFGYMDISVRGVCGHFKF